MIKQEQRALDAVREHQGSAGAQGGSPLDMCVKVNILSSCKRNTFLDPVCFVGNV